MQESDFSFPSKMFPAFKRELAVIRKEYDELKHKFDSYRNLLTSSKLEEAKDYYNANIAEYPGLSGYAHGTRHAYKRMMYIIAMNRSMIEFHDNHEIHPFDYFRFDEHLPYVELCDMYPEANTYAAETFRFPAIVFKGKTVLQWSQPPEYWLNRFVLDEIMIRIGADWYSDSDSNSDDGSDSDSDGSDSDSNSDGSDSDSDDSNSDDSDSDTVDNPEITPDNIPDTKDNPETA